MKKTILTLTVLALITSIACNNSTTNDNNSTNTNASIEAEVANGIVGSWTPVGLDFNLEGKTEPSGKWVTEDPKKRADNIKKAGLTADYADFTFKANGKGFLGGKETNDNLFTYKKLANGKYVFNTEAGEEPKNTRADNIEQLYLDKKGQLIFHHSEKQFIMGKDVVQNTFELYKRK